MNSWRGWGSRNDFECPPLLLWAYSAERIFLICSSGKSADFPELPFHGWGRKGRRYIYHFTCIPLCESRLQKHPQAFPRKTKIGACRWSSCMSRFCFFCTRCGTNHTGCRASRCRANEAASHLKKENGMEEWGLHGMEVPRKSGFSQMLLQAHLLFWCNVVRRTG